MYLTLISHHSGQKAVGISHILEKKPDILHEILGGIVQWC